MARRRTWARDVYTTWNRHAWVLPQTMRVCMHACMHQAAASACHTGRVVLIVVVTRRAPCARMTERQRAPAWLFGPVCCITPPHRHVGCLAAKHCTPHHCRCCLPVQLLPSAQRRRQRRRPQKPQQASRGETRRLFRAQLVSLRRPWPHRQGSASCIGHRTRRTWTGHTVARCGIAKRPFVVHAEAQHSSTVCCMQGQCFTEWGLRGCIEAGCHSAWTMTSATGPHANKGDSCLAGGKGGGRRTYTNNRALAWHAA